MTRLLLILIAVMVFLLAGTGLLASRYHGNAADYKAQRDKAAGNLRLANDTINDMQVRQRDVAALDARYTKELASAEATIDRLHDDVATGRRRLQLSATCKPLPASTPAAVAADGGNPVLTPAAERAYWRLRVRIVVTEGQVRGLQEYIREQCMK